MPISILPGFFKTYTFTHMKVTTTDGLPSPRWSPLFLPYTVLLHQAKCYHITIKIKFYLCFYKTLINLIDTQKFHLVSCSQRNQTPHTQMWCLLANLVHTLVSLGNHYVITLIFYLSQKFPTSYYICKPYLVILFLKTHAAIVRYVSMI